jgi:Plasma-membrane choline transporter
VGTWWFAPQEANSFFSRSVRDSLTRACTSSFGSICLGSFLVAVIQVLHHIVFQIRHSRLRGVSLVICLLDYILYVLQSMLEYFNKWGYVYIGLYGYSFWEAGPKVLQLFSNRGWSTIINDRLISRVLTGMSLIIGLLNGVLAEVIVALFPSFLNVEVEVEDDGVEAIIGIPFLVGSFIGFMVSHLLLSVISSALDTVLVCFAEAPMEFRQNHPLLFEQMDQAWRDKFPNEYRVVTLDAVAVSILHEPSGTLT